MKNLVYITLLIFCGFAHAQTDNPNENQNQFEKKENSKDSTNRKLVKLKIDTAAINKTARQEEFDVFESIDLDKVIVVAPYKFKNRAERQRYLILRRKTKKVWPYAVLAAERLTTLRERLDTIKSNSVKRRYTKIVQHYVEDEFAERLKKLTKTEGQILVKLMYRQTGETTFDIVRDLRSGWRAFWYNVTANLFTISLKEKYDPYAVKEDYFIEHILHRAFQKNQLKEQPPAIEIDFSKSMEKWK